MVDLSSFDDQLNAVIIGSSGGIGGGFAKLLCAHPQLARLQELNRRSHPPIAAKARASQIDLMDEQSIIEAANTLEKPLDIIIVATGLLHHDGLQPEKSWRQFSLNQAQEIFNINAFAPMLIAKHFLPKLRLDKKSVFAVLSAKVGSISDNALGGWYSYRASKAALNQFIRCASIELGRKNKNAVCIALHPGTVATNLSKPFQSAVKTGKLFDTEKAAHYLIEVINRVSPAETGTLYSWNGDEIAP